MLLGDPRVAQGHKVVTRLPCTRLACRVGGVPPPRQCSALRASPVSPPIVISPTTGQRIATQLVTCALASLIPLATLLAEPVVAQAADGREAHVSIHPAGLGKLSHGSSSGSSSSSNHDRSAATTIKARPDHPSLSATASSAVADAAPAISYSSSGQGESDHGQEEAGAPGSMVAPPGTAAARFSCTPLGPHELARAIDTAGFHHRIHTSSAEAQALFNQGLLLAYDFDQPAALAAFKEGLKADPHAPMLHWGIAYASGPFLNKVAASAPADVTYPVFTPAELADAQRALKAALALLPSVTPPGASPAELAALARDRSYVEAAWKLYGGLEQPYGPKWEAVQRQYAADMEAIAASDPADADAAALAADARMNLSPWAYWTRTAHGPYTPVNADDIVVPAFQDLQTALRRDPGHPLAAHLMIHLAEAGKPGHLQQGHEPSLQQQALRQGHQQRLLQQQLEEQDRLLEGQQQQQQQQQQQRQQQEQQRWGLFGFAAAGESAADALATRGLGGGAKFRSMGHLTHMSSHLYNRVGRWHDSIVANERALQADEAMARRCIEPYDPGHNAAMLQFAAAMGGQASAGLRYAHDVATFPETFGPTYMADGRGRAALPLFQARFAIWGPLLQLQPSDLSLAGDGVMLPPGAEEYSAGVVHYVRALALAAEAERGRVGGAAVSAEAHARIMSELESLAAVATALPDDPVTKPGGGIGIYSPGYKGLAQIEALIGSARLAVLDGNWAAATQKLAEAEAIDESFGYTEPPRQLQPIRQCLGWVLLQQGRLAEAEQAYLADLEELPSNPFSLKGLEQVYTAQQQQLQSRTTRDAAPAYEADKKLQEVQAELKKALKHADAGLPFNSSCPAFSDV